MTEITATEVLTAEDRLWREGRQRDYGPGERLVGNDLTVSAALRAYASLLDGTHPVMLLVRKDAPTNPLTFVDSGEDTLVVSVEEEKP